MKIPKPSCMICDYSKHVDVCHVKDVSDFPDDATIGEINDISNLIGLCKNHHWEFDNKLLDAEDKEKSIQDEPSVRPPHRPAL